MDRMSSSEISEWKVYFSLEAADMKQTSGGGSSSGTEVTTLSGTTRVE